MSEAAAPSSSGGASSAFMNAINAGNAPEDADQGGAPTSFKQAMARGQQNADRFDPVKKPGDTPDQYEARQQARQPQRQEQRSQPREQSAEEDEYEREYTAKINGEERKVKAKDLLDSYQRRESANKKFQEASALSKRAEERAAKAEALLRDPQALLKHLINDGDGVKSVHEAYQKMLELSRMTPEQQQEYLRVQALEDRDAVLRQQEEAAEAQRAEEAENAQIDQHLDGMEDAYEKIGWFPEGATEDLAEILMVDMLDRVKEEGIRGVTYRHLATTIRDTIEDTARGWLNAADDDALADLIGEDRLRKLMGGQVRQVQSRLPQTVPRTTNQPRTAGKFAPQAPIAHHTGDMKSFKALLNR